jgi:hypothetical protein
VVLRGQLGFTVADSLTSRTRDRAPPTPGGEPEARTGRLLTVDDDPRCRGRWPGTCAAQYGEHYRVVRASSGCRGDGRPA